MAKKTITDRRPKNRRALATDIPFLIHEKNRRQSCVLKTTYLSEMRAMTYFKNNRIEIEADAHRKLAEGSIEDGVVYVHQRAPLGQ